MRHELNAAAAGADGAPQYRYVRCSWESAAEYVTNFISEVINDTVSSDGGTPALWLLVQNNSSTAGAVVVDAAAPTISDAARAATAGSSAAAPEAPEAPAAVPPAAAAHAQATAGQQHLRQVKVPKVQQHVVDIQELVTGVVPRVRDFTAPQGFIFLRPATKVTLSEADGE